MVNKITINREKLYSLYLSEVSRILDIFEDKNVFTPHEIVGILSTVLENNPELIEEKKHRI